MKSDRKMKLKNEETSGYTDDLAKEINKGIEAIGSDRFIDFSPVYVSNSGSARLLSATRYGKRYILKCLKEDFRYNPIFRTALTKEFEIGIALDHPNIRRTIGFEDLDELGPTIIMEYVDGDTLEAMMERGEINATNARRIAVQLTEALAYLHRRQVVHRDLKPSNIMVTHSGMVVKLIDLSLADTDSYTIIKTSAGTKSYMAPEQRKPEAKANVKGDIYSLGIILHDLAVLAGDKKLLKASTACTAKDPERRPDSVEQLNIQEIDKDRSFSFSSLLSSAITTYILLAFIILLIIVGAAAWMRRSKAEEPSPLPSSASGVEVIDSRLWPAGE